MTKFFLINIRNDGRGGGDDIATTGPYKTASDQVHAAEELRDGGFIDESGNLLWLDIEYVDSPIVGAFDPRFWEGKR